jgi:hypothetical protein
MARMLKRFAGALSVERLDSRVKLGTLVFD